MIVPVSRIFVIASLLTPAVTFDANAQNTVIHDKHKSHSHHDKKHSYYDNRKKNVNSHSPRLKKNSVIVITPRKRIYHNVHIYRPYGHAYLGYGHFHNDNDAWKWLSFTSITIKLLDNLNEHTQREHEAAQIKATTAKVGEEIKWHSESSNGSVVTTKEGVNNAGLTCREFQQTITISGDTEQAFGTACLQADGSWKIVK
ncbi:hypothetical protein [Pseudoalteromonas denitrificans]|uniref:Surface antigen domain-containing protein n=1 Tax=Pseudoalteromonas denitrificans DSM 6059 TaxID=1123010 RepID=A0A1I1QG37_9GAMM|nr:hypothetical protein [Pseudoalteromonas denitrificans]SFD21035.1 hypothetical protein SAMN02745724_03871 [Pseudoalteromonas denitrificans DSM 6059]